MLNTNFTEKTKPLLRQDQVKDCESERKRLSGMLNGPDHVKKAVQNKGQVLEQLRNIERDLETQRPVPYTKEDLDSAVEREKALREQWMAGMPTAAEMRKAPPGVLAKNIAWEKRNKAKIMEWKNIRKRLHISGDLNDTDKMDAYGVSNVEMYRPVGGAQEANMDRALISGRDYHMGDNPQSVVFTDTDISQLKDLDPEIAAGIATASAEVRSKIKDILRSNTVTNTSETNKVLEGTRCAKEGCGMRVKVEGDSCWHHKEQ